MTLAKARRAPPAAEPPTTRGKASIARAGPPIKEETK
nr:MAG TPA: hypothetical protein [Caudoviricetes sp.]